MGHYKNILIAVDLTEESRQVLAKAVDIAHDAQLSLVFISEPLTYLYGGGFAVDLSNVQTELQNQATKQLESLGTSKRIPAKRQHVLIGKPASEIRRLAEDIKADLIVLGSHSRHGLGLILGSTANGVLHGSPCDVLTVRINSQAK